MTDRRTTLADTHTVLDGTRMYFSTHHGFWKLDRRDAERVVGPVRMHRHRRYGDTVFGPPAEDVFHEHKRRGD